MNQVTEQSLQAATEETKKTHNGITCSLAAQILLAASSHDAVYSLQGVHMVGDRMLDGTVLGNALGELGMAELPEDQDIAFLDFDHPAQKDLEITAVVFPQDDLVAVNARIEPDYMEPMYGMTIANFFRFLNTIPNGGAFSDTENLKSPATPEGLYLLDKLANASSN